MTSLAEDLLIALDPVELARRAGLSPDAWQERALRSEARQQILNASRQSGKSTVCAAKALHQALYRPGSVTLVTAPSQRQAAELLRKVRDLLSRLPDLALDVDQESVLSLGFANESRIMALPGSEHTIRGFTADLVLIDEAARVPDDLVAAVRPMIGVRGGQLILLSTPWGQRGAFFRAWKDGGDAWERTLVTGRDVPRFDPVWLEQERRELPPLMFASEYEGVFCDIETQVFATELVVGAFTSDVKPLFAGGVR